jgi:amino acid transporter
VVLQGALAILLLYVHTIGELLSNVAGILVFFSALVAVGLFRVRRHKPNLRAPRPQALIAAAIYAGSSIWMLYNAFKTETGLIPWIAIAVAAGLVGYSLARKQTS